MTTTPIAAPMRLPEGYGRPTATLDWGAVRDRLERAACYWFATTRPDGRPHVVPLDGLWLDDLWYFGGGPDAVHQRNLRHNRRVAINLEDTMAAVIVAGTAATASRYAGGVWRLRPAVVLAWDRLDVDATRFAF